MIRRKNVGTSTPEFPPGGVRGQRKRLPVPSRNPKVDGISLSPSRARKILQIHRETRKQPHECPERSSVAHRSGLYKLTSWAPRGALCYGHQIERSASSQPQQEIEHSAPGSRSRAFALAPNYFACDMYLRLMITCITCDFRATKSIIIATNAIISH